MLSPAAVRVTMFPPDSRNEGSTGSVAVWYRIPEKATIPRVWPLMATTTWWAEVVAPWIATSRVGAGFWFGLMWSIVSACAAGSPVITGPKKLSRVGSMSAAKYTVRSRRSAAAV